MFQTLGGKFQEGPQPAWVFPHEHRDQVESFLSGAEEPFQTLISELPEDDVEDVDMSNPRVESEILNMAEHEPSMIQHGQSDTTRGGDEGVIEVDRPSPTDIAEPLTATNISIMATAARQTTECITMEGAGPVISTTTTTVTEVVAELTDATPSASTILPSEPMNILSEPLLLLTEVGSLPFPSAQGAEPPATGPSAPSAPSQQPTASAGAVQSPLAVDTTSAHLQGAAQADAPTVLPFSPRLYALVGNAKPWESQLSKLGGRFKKHVKIGDSKFDAWTFPKRNLDNVHSVIPGLVVTQPVVQEHDAAAVVSPTKRRRTDSGATHPSASTQQASAVA